MGCSSSSSRGLPSTKHDVCVTCMSPVLAPDDFAGFFGDWIMKACAEMKLTCISSRPQLGPELPKAGSRLEQQLRQAVITSKVAVCIMNMTKGCEMPPPGYKAEVTWAEQRSIPVVPFYDADRYDWKEAAAWKVELPAAYRWGLGPVRYRRTAHDEAKEQLRAALRSALQDLEFRVSAEAAERSERGRLAAAAQTLAAGGVEGGALGELSRAEMRLRDSTSQDMARRRAESAADEADLEENALGLDRSDFERAGLVQQKLERTNSMRDINLDSALAILARGAGQQRDPLAAREGGCRLQLIAGNEEVSAELLQGNEPKHRLLAPVQGILRKAKSAVSKSAMPQSAVKQLRLSPEALEERRFRFSVQLLRTHLDGLRSDDVHELITVLKCLQGDQELVMRSLRLLKAFLEAHMILHDRALQQGMVQSVVAVMRQTPEVDVLTLGVACLSSVLHGAAQRGLLGPEALGFCGASQLQAAPAQEDLVTSISRSGGVIAILDGMQRFPACEGLQDRGCLCLALLTAGTEDNKVSADYTKGKHQESSVLLRSQSRRLVVRQGGLELLLNAMQRFQRNLLLQRSAAMAVGQLSTELRTKESNMENKALQLLMQAMRKHKRDAVVPRYVAAALRQFATHSVDMKTLIAQCGGIEELQELAQRGLQEAMPPHGDLQRRAAATEAIGALCHLASKHPENKLRIFDAGCLELAFQALGLPQRSAAEAAEATPDATAADAANGGDGGDAAALEAEMAMAACGLLHNMSVDAAIRSHVVKLGGREAAQLLSRHPESAVRNLAKLLAKTLKPREEASGDPFQALFAQRTPGLAAPRRVASKKGRKIATEVTASYSRSEDPEEGEETAEEAAEEAEEAAQE